MRCAASSKCCTSQRQAPQGNDSKTIWNPLSDSSWPRCIWLWSVSALSSGLLGGCQEMFPHAQCWAPPRSSRGCVGWSLPGVRFRANHSVSCLASLTAETRRCKLGFALVPEHRQIFMNGEKRKLNHLSETLQTYTH